jgi:hypothetical protein
MFLLLSIYFVDTKNLGDVFVSSAGDIFWRLS